MFAHYCPILNGDKIPRFRFEILDVEKHSCALCIKNDDMQHLYVYQFTNNIQKSHLQNKVFKVSFSNEADAHTLVQHGHHIIQTSVTVITRFVWRSPLSSSVRGEGQPRQQSSSQTL